MALLTMTIISTAIAATTSVIAWRVVQREARRSDARVAALASAIFGPEGPVSAEKSAAIASFPSEYSADASAASSASRLTGHRSLAALWATALVVAGLLILAATRQRGSNAPPRGTAISGMSAAPVPSTRRSAEAVAAAPLELIALSHERAKDTLIVRGAIRNPSDGTACEVPAVVVLAFDEHGIFLGSSESDPGGESLPPGARATFSVSISAGTTTPARYRVSFRNAGRVVPHVDRRAPDAAAGHIGGASNVREEGRVRS